MHQIRGELIGRARAFGMDDWNYLKRRQLVPVVVRSDSWVAPVRNLICEDLGQCLSGQAQVRHFLASLRDVVRECSTAGHQRHIRIGPIARISVSRQRVCALVSNIADSKVGHVARKVATAGGGSVAIEGDSQPIARDASDPCVDCVVRPRGAGSVDLRVTRCQRWTLPRDERAPDDDEQESTGKESA